LELKANVTIIRAAHGVSISEARVKLRSETSHNQCERTQTESSESCDCVSFQTLYRNSPLNKAESSWSYCRTPGHSKSWQNL